MPRHPAAVERENPQRAVFLTSDVDVAAFEKLAPEIIRLRLANQEPICLFIHSFGGSPLLAERLLRLIRAPRPDGQRCMVTTVCIGVAASAAADMLSAGDYAIAYNDATIVVHGTREQHDELTAEKIREVAVSLHEANDYFAMKLANQMFRRFATQALLLEAFKTDPPSVNIVAVGAEPIQIFARIREAVQPEHEELINAAVAKMERITDLVEYSRQFPPSPDESGEITRDCQLLKTLAEYEAVNLQKKKDEGDESAQFDRDTIDRVGEDFEELKDFYSGRYFKKATDLSRAKGHYFLTSEEMVEFKKAKTKEDKDSFLEKHAAPKIMPLWYLVVSLCRALQMGEHVFTPHDAWWFGLVDEVPGSKLPSMRLWKTQRRSSSTQTSATNTQAPSPSLTSDAQQPLELSLSVDPPTASAP